MINDSITPTIYTILDLLRNYQIEVPALQRDYAFGRTGEVETEKRRQFANALVNALQPNHQLQLDFVYGKPDEQGRLIILDGQQRITTLWLLAVYLTKQSGHQVDADITSYLTNFSYDTRISSREFCQALVKNNWSAQDIDPDKPYFNQPWFFHAWRQDPTVTGMVTMLRSIDQAMTTYFKTEKLPSIQTLTQLQFSFLNITQLGNPEELYLKMNSRGKHLTSWDDFKTTLFQHVDSVTTSEFSTYFKQEVDTTLLDWFWALNQNNAQKSKDAPTETEISLFQFFKSVIKVEAILKQANDSSEAISLVDNLTQPLVETDWQALLNSNVLRAIEVFWKFLHQEEQTPTFAASKFERFVNVRNTDEPANIRFTELITKLTQPDLTASDFVLFATYYLFAKNRLTSSNDYETSLTLNADQVDDLYQAVRVASNETGRLSRTDNNRLVHLIPKIQTYLVDSNTPVLGAVINSMDDEESTKAKLITENANWATLLYQVEREPVSSGAANWLLELSDSNFKIAQQYYKQLFVGENAFFATDQPTSQRIANLFSYTVNLQRKDAFPVGQSQSESNYTWWDFFMQLNHGNGSNLQTAFKAFLDNQFEANTNLANEPASLENIPNLRIWYLKVPQLLDDYQQLRPKFYNFYQNVIVYGNRSFKINKYSLQITALALALQSQYTDQVILNSGRDKPDQSKTQPVMQLIMATDANKYVGALEVKFPDTNKQDFKLVYQYNRDDQAFATGIGHFERTFLTDSGKPDKSKSPERLDDATTIDDQYQQIMTKMSQLMGLSIPSN